MTGVLIKRGRTDTDKQRHGGEKTERKMAIDQPRKEILEERTLLTP